MVRFGILALSVCLAYGAPHPKGYPKGLGQGGGVGYTDTFRPRFPGVDDAVKEEDLLLLKVPAHLEPNPDKHPFSHKPIGAEEDPDSTIVQKPSGFDLHPIQKMYDSNGGKVSKPVDGTVVRDVVEKPIVEKTIIKVCDCEKHIEEKHIDDEQIEQKPVEPVYVPEESQFEGTVINSRPDLTVYDSKKDPYDVPVNPEFGQPPSDVPEGIPVQPELTQPQDSFEKPAGNPEVYPEQPSYEPIDTSLSEPAVPVEETVNHEEKLPSVPFPDYYEPEKVNPQPELPEVVPEQPVEEGKLPAGYDYSGEKTPQVVPEDSAQPELTEDKQPEDTPKKEVNVIIFPPAINPQDSAENAKEPIFPLPDTPTSEDTGSEYPKEPVYPIDDTSSPDVDVKPEPIPEDSHPKTPLEEPVEKAAEVPVEPQYPVKPVYEHVDPEVPVQPVDELSPVPVVPGNTIKPDFPPYPGKPVEEPAVLPVEPEYPTKPEEKPAVLPVEPEYPSKPEDKPAVLPVEPEYPTKPEDKPSVLPVEPEYPVKPVEKPDVLPAEPEYPVKPVDEPAVVPVEPVQPVEPEVPAVPEDPIKPDVSLTPEVPEDPQNPVAQPTTTIGTVCEDLGLRKFLYLLNKAGYRDMLTRKRPLTIFVPSDEAWQRLPLPVLNRLHRDRGFLRRVLRYHMVDALEQGLGRQDYYCPSMQQGNGLYLNTFEKKMYVNGLPVTASLAQPNNGAVYVIQRVLFPFPARNLAEAIQSTGTFTRFYGLASEAGLLDHELSGTGPYTLFAPTDEAFAKLPPKTVEWLSWDKAALRALLRKHLVSGTHYTSFVPKDGGDHLKALDGSEILVKHADGDKPGDLTVNDAHLNAFDLTTRNGVLHAVDEVLFAQDLHPKPFQRPILKRIYA